MDSLCFSDENHMKFSVDRTIINDDNLKRYKFIFHGISFIWSELRRSWYQFHRRNIRNTLTSFLQRSNGKCGNPGHF